MDYLTVKEVAELKECSVQYIQKLVKAKKLEAIQELNPDNNCMQYKIPVSALPEEIQLRYYNSIRKSESAPPQLKESPKAKKQHKNTVKRSFEEYSQAERDEITRWVTILEEWQALRSQYKRKTEFDPMYCSKIKIEQPDISISKDILYRKYAAYKADEEQRITAIDMKIRKAYERSEEFKIELPSKIIPIRANEEEAFPAAVNSDTLPVTIDYRRINQNLLQRKENDNG